MPKIIFDKPMSAYPKIIQALKKQDFVAFRACLETSKDDVDSEGWSALHYACAWNLPEYVEALMSVKCLASASKEGETPIDVALTYKSMEVLEVLNSHFPDKIAQHPEYKLLCEYREKAKLIREDVRALNKYQLYADLIQSYVDSRNVTISNRAHTLESIARTIFAQTKRPATSVSDKSIAAMVDALKYYFKNRDALDTPLVSAKVAQITLLLKSIYQDVAFKQTLENDDRISAEIDKMDEDYVPYAQKLFQHPDGNNLFYNYLTERFRKGNCGAQSAMALVFAKRVLNLRKVEILSIEKGDHRVLFLGREDHVSAKDFQTSKSGTVLDVWSKKRYLAKDFMRNIKTCTSWAPDVGYPFITFELDYDPECHSVQFESPGRVILPLPKDDAKDHYATEMRGYYISRKHLTRAQKVESLTRIAALAPEQDKEMILSVVKHKNRK